MIKIYNYALLKHFYKKAIPINECILVKIKERNIENTPLDGVYSFKYLNSCYSINELYEIITKINDFNMLQYIKNIYNLSKWYYIGKEVEGEDLNKFISDVNNYVTYQSRLSNLGKVINPYLEGSENIIINQEELDSIGQIFDPNIRSKSKILLKDIKIKNKKYL